MQPSPKKKIYLTDINDATFGCNRCGRVQKIDLDYMILTRKGFRIKCVCNELYDVEFRKKHRKNVKLAAVYKSLSQAEVGEAIIEDISMRGIGFTVLPSPQFKEYDLLNLSFSLDNPQRTRISIDVKIVYILGHKIGAEIHDWQYNQKHIGYYLFP